MRKYEGLHDPDTVAPGLHLARIGRLLATRLYFLNAAFIVGAHGVVAA
jgi:hypothetical protein